MQHDLGDTPIAFFGKNIPLHSPLRHYYHFSKRDAFIQGSLGSFELKLVDGWRLCLKYVFYSLFAKPRLVAPVDDDAGCVAWIEGEVRQA